MGASRVGVSCVCREGQPPPAVRGFGVLWGEALGSIFLWCVWVFGSHSGGLGYPYPCQCGGFGVLWYAQYVGEGGRGVPRPPIGIFSIPISLCGILAWGMLLWRRILPGFGLVWGIPAFPRSWHFRPFWGYFCSLSGSSEFYEY